MLSIGLSTCSKQLDLQLFTDCAKDGISALEISPSQGHYEEVDFAAIRRYANASGLRLWSFHLPFMPFETIDISSLNTAVRKSTVAYNAELIRKAAAIGIDKFVIHPSAEPIKNEERADRMQAAMESLATLAHIAASCGGVIAVENLPRTCLGKNSEEILRLLEADGRLRTCFDTNHLLSEPIADFIRNVGNKIITTHVSDYDFIDEKHWLPGEGKINWHELYKELTETDYSGVWMYELGFASPSSLSRSRDLQPADFVRNAREIFAGKEITVIS